MGTCFYTKQQFEGEESEEYEKEGERRCRDCLSLQLAGERKRGGCWWHGRVKGVCVLHVDVYESDCECLMYVLTLSTLTLNDIPLRLGRP